MADDIKEEEEAEEEVEVVSATPAKKWEPPVGYVPRARAPSAAPLDTAKTALGVETSDSTPTPPPAPLPRPGPPVSSSSLAQPQGLGGSGNDKGTKWAPPSGYVPSKSTQKPGLDLIAEEEEKPRAAVYAATEVPPQGKGKQEEEPSSIGPGGYVPWGVSPMKTWEPPVGYVPKRERSRSHQSAVNPESEPASPAPSRVEVSRTEGEVSQDDSRNANQRQRERSWEPPSGYMPTASMLVQTEEGASAAPAADADAVPVVSSVTAQGVAKNLEAKVESKSVGEGDRRTEDLEESKTERRQEAAVLKENIKTLAKNFEEELAAIGRLEGERRTKDLEESKMESELEAAALKENIKILAKNFEEEVAAIHALQVKRNDALKRKLESKQTSTEEEVLKQKLESEQTSAEDQVLKQKLESEQTSAEDQVLKQKLKSEQTRAAAEGTQLEAPVEDVAEISTLRYRQQLDMRSTDTRAVRADSAVGNELESADAVSAAPSKKQNDQTQHTTSAKPSGKWEPPVGYVPARKRDAPPGEVTGAAAPTPITAEVAEEALDGADGGAEGTAKWQVAEGYVPESVRALAGQSAENIPSAFRVSKLLTQRDDDAVGFASGVRFPEGKAEPARSPLASPTAASPSASTPSEAPPVAESPQSRKNLRRQAGTTAPPPDTAGGAWVPPGWTSQAGLWRSSSLGYKASTLVPREPEKAAWTPPGWTLHAAKWRVAGLGYLSSSSPNPGESQQGSGSKARSKLSRTWEPPAGYTPAARGDVNVKKESEVRPKVRERGARGGEGGQGGREWCARRWAIFVHVRRQPSIVGDKRRDADATLAPIFSQMATKC